MRYCKALLIILLILFTKLSSVAQCNGDFLFESFPAVNKYSTGKIEVTLKNVERSNYVFKIYRVSGEIKLIQTKEVQTPEKVLFENLEPSDYYIKIEWGQSCQKTIGGLEGIQVLEKAEIK